MTNGTRDVVAVSPGVPKTGAGAKSLKDGGTVQPVREILWGAQAGAHKYETAEELPDDMRKLVVKLMVVQADTEFASIQQHRPWLDRAPTLEDRWIECPDRRGRVTARPAGVPDPPRLRGGGPALHRRAPRQARGPAQARGIQHAVP